MAMPKYDEVDAELEERLAKAQHTMRRAKIVYALMLIGLQVVFFVSWANWQAAVDRKSQSADIWANVVAGIVAGMVIVAAQFVIDTYRNAVGQRYAAQQDLLEWRQEQD